jgi:hypothetical protein
MSATQNTSGRLDDEVAFHQIRGLAPVSTMGRRQVACAAAHPGLTCRSHQSCYALAADTNAGGHQLDKDPGEPVRAARADVDRSNPLAQHRIFERTLRGRAGEPRAIAAGKNTQCATQDGNPMLGLIRLHELESLRDRAGLLCSTKPRLKPKISRSSLSRRLSQRKRVSSCRSALLKPSSRRPASQSACRASAHGPHEPTRLCADGTPADTLHVFSASWIPPSPAIKSPRKRGNSRSDCELASVGHPDKSALLPPGFGGCWIGFD